MNEISMTEQKDKYAQSFWYANAMVWWVAAMMV